MTATVLLPPAGNSIREAIFHRGMRQRVSPYASRTGADSAIRAFAAASSRSEAATRGAVDVNGSATGVPRSRRASACTTTTSRRRPVEPLARLTLDDLHLEALANDLGIDASPVDVPRDLAELVCHGCVVRADGGRLLEPDEAADEPLVATNGAEAPSCRRSVLDRGLPVGRDPEL